MKSRLVAFITAIIINLCLIPGQAALAEADADVLPERLHFASAIDANIYTERLVYEAFNRLGIEITITLEDMNIGLNGVNAGVYDGICNQSAGMEDRYDQLIAVPVETSICHFYALTLLGDSYVCNAWNDLSGKRVGTLSGKNYLANALPKDIVSHIETSSMSLLYELLRTGECDVIVIADTSGKSVEQLVLPSGIRVAGTVETMPCCIFLNKKYTSLVDRIVGILAEMEQDGSLAKIKAMQPMEERKEKVVLYLSSYSAEMQWEQNLLQGISNVFNQQKDIKFHNISLNAYRNTNVGLREIAALNTISVDFSHSPPDAVIVSDNEAMSFLLNYYNIILPNDIPVIACGMNNTNVTSALRLEQYPNVAAIVESIGAANTVEMMLKLFPSTQNIFVINDYTLTGRRWRNEIQTQLEPFTSRVHISYNENVPYDELIAQVSELDTRTLILSGSYFTDSNEYYYSQATVQSGLQAAARVPIFGLFDDSKVYGQLGGQYTNALQHGQIAASYLVDALKRGNSSQLTFVEPEADNFWVFNWDVMQRYGIKRNQLPEGATILNAPRSLRADDPVLFYSIIVAAIAGLVIIILLAIFAMALQRRNNKLVAAEADIRKSHNEIEAARNHLQTILDNAPIAYSLLVDDIVVECNSYYKQHVGTITGRKNGEKYQQNAYYAQLMEECREKGFVSNIYWHVTRDNGEKIRYLYNIALSEYEGQEAIVMWGVDIERLEQQKEALNQANHSIQELTVKVMTDSLTGLYTREASRQLVDEYIFIAPKMEISAFMIIDLDSFKTTNDTMGHPYGDEVLRKVAEAIKSTFRKSDIMIRIGGDEFAVFLKSIPGQEFAINKANQLLTYLHALGEAEDHGDHFSASIGISFFPESGSSFNELYRVADEALYEAKRGGKNQYVANTGNIR